MMRHWLPLITDCPRPWSSAHDLSLGSRWPTELARQLEVCDFGILVVTADNIAAPWLLFEAGALSKNSATARVIPYLVGVAPADLVGPLRYFHAVEANRDGTLRLVQDIAHTSGVTAAQVESRFELLWPKFEAILNQTLTQLTPAAKKADSLASAVQPLSQRVDELTALVRNLVETNVVGTSRQTQLNADLRELEGGWVSDRGSHLYARIVGSDLHVPYSFRGNDTLNGAYTRWQRVGDYWFATYRWLEHKIQGFIFCRLLNSQTIEGMWWATKRGTGELEHRLPDQSGQRMRWSRKPSEPIPDWAETYFRDAESRSATA